jgi:hypothetical protein
MEGVMRDASNERSDEVEHQQPRPGPEHEVLEVILGKWINEGYTVETADAPSTKILTSDVYGWSTGGFFVLHTAYGRVGDAPGGGIEIIGHDPASRKSIARFFNSQGGATMHELTIEGDTWIWLGEKTCCTAVFTDGGRTQTAHVDAISAGRQGAAVELFLTGPAEVPTGAVAQMRQAPIWPDFEAVAHTLAYDAAFMDGTQLGRPCRSDGGIP